jgi:hypothetical protein
MPAIALPWRRPTAFWTSNAVACHENMTTWLIKKLHAQHRGDAAKHIEGPRQICEQCALHVPCDAVCVCELLYDSCVVYARTPIHALLFLLKTRLLDNANPQMPLKMLQSRDMRVRKVAKTRHEQKEWMQPSATVLHPCTYSSLYAL